MLVADCTRRIRERRTPCFVFCRGCSGSWSARSSPQRCEAHQGLHRWRTQDALIVICKGRQVASGLGSSVGQCDGTNESQQAKCNVSEMLSHRLHKQIALVDGESRRDRKDSQFLFAASTACSPEFGSDWFTGKSTKVRQFWHESVNNEVSFYCCVTLYKYVQYLTKQYLFYFVVNNLSSINGNACYHNTLTLRTPDDLKPRCLQLFPTKRLSDTIREWAVFEPLYLCRNLALNENRTAPVDEVEKWHQCLESSSSATTEEKTEARRRGKAAHRKFSESQDKPDAPVPWRGWGDPLDGKS